MSLSEARFHDLVDAAQEEIEDVFDHSGMDVDLENSGGVLTVRFENGTQLIFSRQPPLRQLWVAARSGGFHFDYDESSSLWICDANDERLGELLSRVTQEQGGEALEFEDLKGWRAAGPSHDSGTLAYLMSCDRVGCRLNNPAFGRGFVFLSVYFFRS